MKSLRQYISEARAIDQIEIKDSKGDIVNATEYAYDKESFEKMVDKYDSLFIATMKNKSTWTVDTDNSFKIYNYRQDDGFMVNKDERYSKDEIISLIENGNIMVIAI